MYPRSRALLVILCSLFVVKHDIEAQSIAETAVPVSAQFHAQAALSRLNSTEGGKLVLRAIEAHGGLEAWYSAPTSAYSWEYSNAGMNLRFKTYLVADNASRRVYHRITELGTPDNPQPAEGRFAWDGNEAWISPAEIKQPNPRFWAATGYYFESIPFVLADPGISYELLPVENLDGVAHDMVRISYGESVGDSPGDLYTLYVNQDTGLVAAIRYTVSFGRTKVQASSRPIRETLFYYDDYVTVDGLTVPTHFRGYGFIDGERGAFKNEAWASDFSFRQPFDASQLIMPPGGRVQPMPGK